MLGDEEHTRRPPFRIAAENYEIPSNLSDQKFVGNTITNDV